MGALSNPNSFAIRISKHFFFVLAQLEGPPQKIFSFNGNFNGKMTKKIKWPKITFPGSKMVPMGVFGYFGGIKNGTSGAPIEILRPLFNTNTPPKTPI